MGLIALVLVAMLAVGCTQPVVREPVLGPHTLPPDQWLSELDEPPPAVQVEEVPVAPGPAYVWVDGQWIWQPLARRWTWEQGAWCVPPPGAIYYARPGIERYRFVEGRIKRWNESLQRFEEVDSGDDRFRWAKGRFYVRAPDGSAVASRQQAFCDSTGSRTR